MRPLTLAAGLAAAGLVSTAVVALPLSGSAAPAAPSAVSRAAKQPNLSQLKISFAKRTGALSSPTQVTNAVDGSSRLFVAQQGGLVRVYKGKGKLQAKPYLDIRSKVRDSGEQGLLGIAFRKDFSKKPRIYVAYTAKNGSLQLSRFTPKSKKSTTVASSTERKILNVPHPDNTNHNGGSLSFGKDGYLYVGTGDGGGTGDPGNNAQNKNKLLGKILRIDVSRSCSGKNYCNLKSNPYFGAKAGRAEIWAIGLRNPWRTSIDPKTGALWIGDVGQNAHEEIDRIPAAKAGWNLGWPCREGKATYDAGRCRSGVTYRAPVATYSHAKGQSVTGGFVYRGKQYSKLIAGRYVYADFITGRVFLRGTSGATRQVGALGQISSFGVSGGGEIFAVTLDGGLWAMKVSKV